MKTELEIKRQIKRISSEIKKIMEEKYKDFLFVETPEEEIAIGKEHISLNKRKHVSIWIEGRGGGIRTFTSPLGSLSDIDKEMLEDALEGLIERVYYLEDALSFQEKEFYLRVGNITIGKIYTIWNFI